MSEKVDELGRMKMFNTGNKIGKWQMLWMIVCTFLVVGLVGYVIYLDNQTFTLKSEVVVLQEQNLVSNEDVNNLKLVTFGCQIDQNRIPLTICGSFVKYPVKPKSMDEVNEIVSNFGRCIPDENNLINECQLCEVTRNIGWQCIDKSYLESIKAQEVVQ